ncbi:MAG: nitroreductase family deazaflavin-dependent oxidoreductase [Anaerolineae bacterium]
MSDWNKAIIDEFRANGGKVGGHFANQTLLLLHTKGAKSGQERVNPVVTFVDNNRHVIIASKGGAPTDPDWYKNLVANPEVEVEIGTERFPAVASVATEPERTRLYERMEAINPAFTDYKSKTDRVLPVITLTRK